MKKKKVSQNTSQMIFSENIHSNGLKNPMSDCAEQSSVTKTLFEKEEQTGAQDIKYISHAM